MEQLSENNSPHDVYSLRDRIEEQRSHTPLLCGARLQQAVPRAAAVYGFGERSDAMPRASTGRSRLVT